MSAVPVKKENQLNIKLASAEIKEELNNKLNQEQQNHNLDIQEYQSKYKALLEQMEKERAAHTTTKKNNVAEPQNKTKYPSINKMGFVYEQRDSPLAPPRDYIIQTYFL